MVCRGRSFCWGWVSFCSAGRQDSWIGCVARLSPPFLGVIRLGVEEAWLPQTTCRGACRFNVPADRQSWDRSIPWLGRF